MLGLARHPPFMYVQIWVVITSCCQLSSTELVAWVDLLPGLWTRGLLAQSKGSLASTALWLIAGYVSVLNKPWSKTLNRRALSILKPRDALCPDGEHDGMESNLHLSSPL